MIRPAKTLAGVLIAVYFLWAVGRAADHEFAVAQEPPIALEQPGYRVQGHTAEWWRRRAVQARKDANARGRTIRGLKAELATHSVSGISPTLAIRLVFGGYADAALRVAWCESRWYTGVTNGQYLGLFQMGSHERATYGHSRTALGQARAAYAYFVDTGRDWSPWECKP